MLTLSDELRALARMMDEQATIAGKIARLLRLLSNRAHEMEQSAAVSAADRGAILDEMVRSGQEAGGYDKPIHRQPSVVCKSSEPGCDYPNCRCAVGITRTPIDFGDDGNGARN
jgi:hypothetical protein